VIRLLGVVPDPAGLKEHETAYMMMLCNLHCQPAPAAEQLAALSVPENRPEGLRQLDLTPYTTLPNCRQTLFRLLDGLLASLRVRVEVLKVKDSVERARVVSPNLNIKDDTEANRFYRYLGESRTMFLRCFNALEATLERDASSGRDEVDDSQEDSGTADTSTVSVSPTAPEPGLENPQTRNEPARTSPQPEPGLENPQTRNEPARTPHDPSTMVKAQRTEALEKSSRTEANFHRSRSDASEPGPGPGPGGG
jgi:hypothetical protein